VVCRSCGTAGAIFVEAETSIEQDPDAESLYQCWLQRAEELRWSA
jgi:hypothetical protein